MEESAKHAKCVNKNKVFIVCLSPTCKAPSAFQCQVQSCLCKSAHTRCKNMRWQAVQDYLFKWQNLLCPVGRDFIKRTQKILANIRDKLERQECIFRNYCREIFMGNDYTQVVHLLQKRQFHLISSKIIASALKKITEPTQSINFQSFTLGEMKKIDQKILSLFQTVSNIYKSKEEKKIQPIKRCNSATLNKLSSSLSTNFNSEQFPIKPIQKMQSSRVDNILLIKTDLTYPKVINSHILRDATVLNKFIYIKIKKYHLIYRGTANNFNISEFYRKVQVSQKHLIEKAHLKDDKPLQYISLILVKTEYGKVLGGYTSLKWQYSHQNLEIDSQQDDYILNPEQNYHRKRLNNKLKTDPTGSTSLFSVDINEKYQLLKPDEAIYCGKNRIGFGRCDLRIVNQGNSIRKNYCKFPSSYNCSSQPYINESKSGMLLSGGKYSQYFKIDEWQCFFIEY